MLVRRDAVIDPQFPAEPETCEAKAPDPTPNAAAAAKTASTALARSKVPDRNAVERQRALDNDPDAGAFGLASERTLRAAFQKVPRAGKVAIELELDAKLKLAVGGKLKFHLERTADDRYQVTFAAGASGGIGVGAVVAEAKLVAALEGRLTLSFGSAEEAADKVAALAQAAGEVSLRASNVPGFVVEAARQLQDPDTLARSLSAIDNVSKLKLELSLEASASAGKGKYLIGPDELGAKAKAAGKVSVEIDYAKRTLTMDQSLELGASAAPPAWGLGIAEGELKAAVKLRNSWTLSDADLARLRSGAMSAAAFIGSVYDGHQQELISTLSGKVSVTRFKLERALTFDRTLLDNLDTLFDPTRDWRSETAWMFREKQGVNLGKVVKASAQLSYEMPGVETEPGNAFTALARIREEATAEQSVAANRALANGW